MTKLQGGVYDQTSTPHLLMKNGNYRIVHIPNFLHLNRQNCQKHRGRNVPSRVKLEQQKPHAIVESNQVKTTSKLNY